MNANDNSSALGQDKHIRSLSHDIRNALTVISLYSRYIAEKDEFEISDIKECVALIDQKAKQAMLLFNHLLNGVNVEKVHIKDGKSMLIELLREWGISLRSKFLYQIDMDSCSDFSGNFDIDQLRRIFDNLISNIEKYADPQGVIKMRATTTNADLVIEQENAISQGTTHNNGSGLGLSIIRHIAESHGGNLVVIQDNQKFKLRIKLPILTNVTPSNVD